MIHNPYYKVLWEEGMLVGPHHFQQWDHYHAAMLELRVRHLAPYSWGLIQMEVNPDMLTDCRIFELRALRAVFPSGTVVDIPCGDPLPKTREVTNQSFSGGRQTVGVYLGLPSPAPNTATNGCPPTNSHDLLTNRYVSAYVPVLDENSAQNKREIVTAQKNLRILFEGEPRDGYECLKIAELIVNNGLITLNEDYIPPSLVLCISPPAQPQPLERILDNFIRALSSRIQAAKVHRRHSTLWLLSLINGLTAVLKHFQNVKTIHPEMMYRTLLQFAGQLSVLSNSDDLDVTKINPEYNHEDLAGTFSELKNRLDQLLQIMDHVIESESHASRTRTTQMPRR